MLTCGATPLILLDYVAAAALDLEQVAELVEGAAEVCREAGVALVGGETAELPGVYRDGELDFAGTCVGIVDRDELVDGAAVAAGRRGDRVRLGRRARERVHARAAGPRDSRTTTAPTCSRRRGSTSPRRAGLRGRAKAFAHVTGGGILGNLSRVLPPGLQAELDWESWPRPPVFAWLARHVAEDELRRVFNLGIGWCAVVAEPAPGRDRDRTDPLIGVLVSGQGTNLQALIDAGLPIARGRLQPERRLRSHACTRRRDPDRHVLRSTATRTARSATS